MRKLKTTIGILLMTLFILTAVSCKEVRKDGINTEENHSEMKSDDGHDHSTMVESGMDNTTSDSSHEMMGNDDQKTSKSTMIVDSYLQIKNALVEDNKKEAAKAGKMMLTAFSNFDMTKLTEEQHKEYMEILESANEHAEHIVKSPIDHQREHFEVLGTDIKDLIALVGSEKTLYQDFCPMYNDGKGAMWLSEFKEIKNPYYGSKMLTCGSIQKEL
jgi:hypothetical protein